MNSAVLFIIFNRPALTELAFEKIRKAQPPRLYISIDGPRDGNVDDVQKINSCIKIISKKDWNCELFILKRDSNMGCRLAVSSAIDWFFLNEEMGIIIEDDIIPEDSFFQYCDELLERYKFNNKIGSISGCNPVSGFYEINQSYAFSIFNYIWGWATWRRAWNHYDISMKNYPSWIQSGGLKNISNGDGNFECYWKAVFSDAYAGVVDTWDAQWAFACWSNGLLAAIPEKNLIDNIGFGADATHTRGSQPNYLNQSKPSNMNFPMRHPNLINTTVDLDKIIYKRAFKVSRIRLLIQLIMRIIKNR